MQPKILSILKTLSLTVGAVVSTVVMLLVQDGGFDSSLLVLLLIGIAPYVIFFVLTLLLERFTKLSRIHLIGFIVADLMLMFTVGIYALTWNDRTSPYYVFLFLVVPIYLLIGSLVLLALSVGISWLISRLKK